ncbi:hypothetical protein OC505_25080, partial [Pseudomonas brassicacearum]|nr:hypothetical protein [Pseudomonas brassicacearum]
MSIIEVASVCGFVPTPHFSKCYREYFGIPPRDERVGSNTAQQVAMMPIPQAMALSPPGGPLGARPFAGKPAPTSTLQMPDPVGAGVPAKGCQAAPNPVTADVSEQP